MSLLLRKTRMWFWSKQHKKSIYILELRPSSGIISRMIVNKSMCNPKPNFLIRCTESVIYYYDRNNDITGKAFCGLESAPTDDLFCRSLLNFSLSEVSLWLYSGYVYLAGLSQKCCCVPHITSFLVEHNFNLLHYWLS